MRASKKGRHMSGAEGIYTETDIGKIVTGYSRRAILHPKGRPDKIVVTAEMLTERPLKISALPVRTIECKNPEEARLRVKELLKHAGVMEPAIRKYPAILKMALSGAALLSAKTGLRLDADKGIRVSMLGIEENALRELKRKLARRCINTPTVVEALILASKVASSSIVMAELCVSDDPDYTTGYVASRKLGYVRITNIKAPRGGGGRVFYIEEGADIEALTDYLKKKPAVVAKIAKIGAVG